MRLVNGPLLHPAFHQCLLTFRERLVRLLGRHGFVGIKNPRDDFARGHVARHNRHRVALGFLERLLAEVETHAGLAAFGVGAVAMKTRVRHDRADVAVKLDDRRQGRLGGGECGGGPEDEC